MSAFLGSCCCHPKTLLGLARRRMFGDSPRRGRPRPAGRAGRAFACTVAYDLEGELERFARTAALGAPQAVDAEVKPPPLYGPPRGHNRGSGDVPEDDMPQPRTSESWEGSTPRLVRKRARRAAPRGVSGTSRCADTQKPWATIGPG